jgi:hypothetical protein
MIGSREKQNINSKPKKDTKIIRMARCISHRVYRVPGFLSSRPNWVPHPLTRECCSPPLDPSEETHSLAGEGLAGPNSDEGTDTLVLYVYYNATF